MEWKLKAARYKRRSISPISRLVNILPDEALEKDDKASLSKIGQSPTTPSVEDTKGPTTEEHGKPENPDKGSSAKIPPRRRRVSVTDRLQSMMTDSNEESSGQSTTPSPAKNNK